MGDKEYVKFVSQKISKVRWRPTYTTLQKPDVFVTGSWEDTNNAVKVWSTQLDRGYAKDGMNDDMELYQPVCCDSCKVPGDVGDICFADQENIIAGVGNGDVMLLKYDSHATSMSLSIQHVWTLTHQLAGKGCQCTGVDAKAPDVVSVGEDGSLHLLRIGVAHPLRTIAQADSCPITDVCFIKSQEVCSVNKMGQLRLWDLRSSRDEPARIIVSSEILVALESVNRHPTRPHILAAGGADGCVTTFDIRKETAPITKLEVHEMEVWEVSFHPTSPDNLFTCSEDGTIRRLDITSELKNADTMLSGNRPPVDVMELLHCQGTAINSLSVAGSRLVCGTDAESIYIVDDIL